jgi:hypothetical protein
MKMGYNALMGTCISELNCVLRLRQAIDPDNSKLKYGSEIAWLMINL